MTNYFHKLSFIIIYKVIKKNPNMFNWLKNIFKTKPIKKRIISDDEYNSLKKDKQDRINEILDKISEKGYSSLTKKEIDFLNKNS